MRPKNSEACHEFVSASVLHLAERKEKRLVVPLDIFQRSSPLDLIARPPLGQAWIHWQQRERGRHKCRQCEYFPPVSEKVWKGLVGPFSNVG